MTTNDTQDQGAMPGGLLDALHGVNWPGAVALLGLLALFVVGPRFGVDPEKTAAGVAAVIAAYGLHHAKQANRQTNGSLTARVRAEVERGTSALRAELPDLIRQALDAPAARPDAWSRYADPYPAEQPEGYSRG